MRVPTGGRDIIQHLDERPGTARHGSSAGRGSTSNVTRLVGRTVVEEGFVCPEGGGFENETWYVSVNDDWVSMADLLRRRSIGHIKAELVSGHDPNGISTSGTLPPQTSFRRQTYVTAPIGTWFRKYVLRPAIDRDKTFTDYLLEGNVHVARRTFEYDFVLRGEERLVSRALDEERRSRPKAPAVEPMTREQTLQFASAALAQLTDGRPSTSGMR